MSVRHIETPDDTLFEHILTHPNHILALLFPEKVDVHYQLRPRNQDRQLVPTFSKMYSCKFIIRMLHKYSY